MKKYYVLLFFMVLFSSIAFANPFIRLDSLELLQTKQKLKNGTASPETLAAYQKLIKDANKTLTLENPSVMDKTLLPPSKNKHDYLSLSRYWWPNPESADGLPWIRHDGKTNPDSQTDAVDRKRLALLGRSVWNLSLAYYFTQDETYSKKAISMIETWFINPETFMHPHLKYGQSIPGYPNTRPFGILDGRSIVEFIPDAVTLLTPSKYWDATHQVKMNTWFSDYLQWLTTSPLGMQASKLENNHGSWYTFQVAGLALYLGDTALVQQMVKHAEQNLETMLNEDGGQIHELERSRSFFYSCFNLDALTELANLGDKVHENMWDYESENKKGLGLALHYLTAVVDGKVWPHDTLKAINFSYLIPILSKFYKKYDDKIYKDFLVKILNDIDSNSQHNRTLQEFWLFPPDQF
ncbi:alginate lyase family protein [Formosa haliotis]|uniref:alginate lyase family protein n=1 Tax=Formosa haliotis TaxID=1555194 RepID=UPI0013564AA1|nr:alginate lyase family protein [Formosa haliotis]